MPRPLGARPPRFARLDRLSQLTVVAACEVAERAGLAPAGQGKSCGGVAVGTHYGAHLSNELFWRGQRGRTGPSPALFAYTLPSAAGAEVSMLLGLTGPSLTLAGAADSGLAAFATAAAQVASGRAGYMLAGAVDVLSPSLLGARADVAHLLEEAAVCALLDSQPEGALARLGGAGQARGSDAEQLSLDAALAQAGLRCAEVRTLLVPERGYSELRGLAAAPLLASAAAIQRGELPCLVLAGDRHGATALCWMAP